MRTHVSKETDVIESILEPLTLGLVKPTTYYKATVEDEGVRATATSNNEQAAVQSALAKLREEKERKH